MVTGDPPPLVKSLTETGLNQTGTDRAHCLGLVSQGSTWMGSHQPTATESPLWMGNEFHKYDIPMDIAKKNPCYVQTYLCYPSQWTSMAEPTGNSLQIPNPLRGSSKEFQLTVGNCSVLDPNIKNHQCLQVETTKNDKNRFKIGVCRVHHQKWKGIANHANQTSQCLQQIWMCAIGCQHLDWC